MTKCSQNDTKRESGAELVIAMREVGKLVAELVIAKQETENSAAELVIAKQEKESSAAELAIAKQEKESRAAELVIAKQDKEKRAAELVIANQDKEKRAAELVIANHEKENRAAELVIAQQEKESRAAELVIAKQDKENRAAELVIANHEKEKHAAELVIAQQEKEKRAAELVIAKRETEKYEIDLSKSHFDLMDSLRGTITAISRAVEARDPYTAGHQRRVAEIACAIAEEMGLDDDQIEGILMGATIHDIGKIKAPAELLSKPTKLTPVEYQLIQLHPATAYEILRDIKFPWPIAEIAYQHHERLDGSGYPQGLKGEEIFLEARIVAVADVVEAMSSHRPYRAALGIEVALDEIKNNSGKSYDSAVVEACLTAFEQKKFSI
jgi:putative nucleotidyltransferase with HDIG domain